MRVSATMKIQQLFPTTGVACDEDPTSFDACVLKKSSTVSPCHLPFLNYSSIPSDNMLPICQTPAEGYAAFQQFQLAPHACAPPCTQLSTDLDYSLPMYLRASYLPSVRADSSVFAYYLHLPGTVKMLAASPSISLISYIAEIAGWYNLFLGGSVFALWEVLWVWAIWVLTKVDMKLDNLRCILKVIFFLLAGGVLIYILMDCFTKLLNKPLGTSSMIKTSLAGGLSLSVCLPQLSSNYIPNSPIYANPFKDLANTTDFWMRGNNLSNKIAELSVKQLGDEWVTLWNRSKVSDALQHKLFTSANIINNDIAVDFCHTIDLSSLPYSISQVQIKAIDDITLVLHLAGQLLRSQNYYEVLNRETLSVINNNNILLYGSEVSFQLEETTFQNVNILECKHYNANWTYDNCVMDFGLSRMEEKRSVLSRLLMPNSTRIDTVVERTVLQDLYYELLSQDVEKICKPDCHSLVVRIIAETSTEKAFPERGIDIWKLPIPQPLPAINVTINLTIPKLSKVNEVRTVLQ